MIKKIDQCFEQSIKILLVVCVLVMLLVTLLNITFRWAEIAVLWIEPLVRHLVFFSAFLGGTLAAGSDQHIKIDLLSRTLKSENSKFILDKVITLITLLAVGFLIFSGIGLGEVEFEYGKKSFLGIHSGYLVSIIPVGASLIGVRLFLRLLMNSKQIIKEE